MTSLFGFHLAPALQERAPQLLRYKDGSVCVSWVSGAKWDMLNYGGMTAAEFHTFVREWPRSEEGRRLLEGLE